MTVASLVDLVGQSYPEPGSAYRLKQATVGTGFPLMASLVPATTECDVLRALATTDRDGAFDPSRLAIEERARSLWERDRKGAETLISSLVGNDLNAIGERVLLALISGMSIDEAFRYADAIPGLVATVVRMNPDVAQSPDLWRGQPDHQRGLFDAATTNGALRPDLQQSMVRAMLQAGSDAAAERAVRKFGPAGVEEVMTWFDESERRSPCDLPEGWRRALAPHTAALLTWLADRKSVREASVALIADLSNPHTAEVHRRGADLWLKSLVNQEPTVPVTVRNRLYAFLLALGFDAPEGGADELVARTFETVHSAVAGNRLGDESWAWFDDHLPTLAVWRYWDRCERLRRGLVKTFSMHDWPVAQLFSCTPNRDLLRDVLKACGKVDGGDRLLKRIRRAVLDGGIELDRQRREVVQWYT